LRIIVEAKTGLDLKYLSNLHSRAFTAIVNPG
jgi:hypothetical protein